MLLLDVDERLLIEAGGIDIVYGPLVDTRVYPETVDVCLVEGAVATPEDVEKLRVIRKNSGIVVALGDCAVTGNVPGMRNQWPLQEVLSRSYTENATHNPGPPGKDAPPLFDRVLPVHSVIAVDLFLPGCPPSADVIFFAISTLIDGQRPDLSGKVRFG
jgi:NAD-reducing hydrogenase small subunit